MSEIGRQLVDNERERIECRHKAKRLHLQMLGFLVMDSDDHVAELNEARVRNLIEAIIAQKYVMRNLLKQYRELCGAASAGD